MSGAGLLYCALLSLQFGLQPVLSSSFQHPSVSRVVVVVVTESLKIGISVLILSRESITTRNQLWNNWTLAGSLEKAALPAILFSVQNLLCQFAYARLDSLAFNVINQTKTLSSAVFLYLLLNQKSSLVQSFALLLLVAAAVLLAVGDSLSFSDLLSSLLSFDFMAMAGGNGGVGIAIDQLGLMATLTASLLSGLSNALTQRAISSSSGSGEDKPSPSRNSFVFSIELALYGLFFLFGKEMWAHLTDGSGLIGRPEDITKGWTPFTFIPVCINACGGLIVGLVVKHAGGIAKGFALIVGIIITGFVQYLVEGKPLTSNHGAAVILVTIAIYLHSNFPPKRDTKTVSPMSPKKGN